MLGWQQQVVTMAAGASMTTIASFYVPMLNMVVELPTLPTAGGSGTVGFLVAPTADGTFRQLATVNASGVTALLQIVSATGNCFYDMPVLGGHHYMKAELVGTITTGTMAVRFFGCNPAT